MEDTKIGAHASKDDPDVVARDAFEAMQAGRSSVVAGSLGKRLQMEGGSTPARPRHLGVRGETDKARFGSLTEKSQAPVWA
jgi:hypothetical protein